jgi:hypothetical protein
VFTAEKIDFCFLQKVQTYLRLIQLPVLSGRGDVPSGIKRRGHEAGHSTVSNVNINNSGAIPPLPHPCS